MSLSKLILKAAVPIPHVEDYQRYLFVGPHPDDIEIGAGATAGKLAAMGKDICFLICTDGQFGDGSAPEGVRGEALVALRKQEAMATADKLRKKEIRLVARAGETGRLYGSITGQEVADALLKQHGVKVEKRRIELSDTIRSVGEYEASVWLYAGISTPMKVIVTAEA